MVQELQFKQEFKELLRSYQASRQKKKILTTARIALFDGPSASGRNTIMYRLVETGNYQQFISDTTRRPRMNNGILEKNGVEYWFKTEEEFLKGLEAGDYIEAAIIHEQQVSGMSVREIERVTKEGKIAVNDVQPDGIEAFRGHNTGAIFFFVIPPSFEVWEARLNTRGKMLPIERQRRYRSAVYEIEHALSVDYYNFIINDNLEVATNKVDAICNGAKNDSSSARIVAQGLLADIQSHLT